MALPRELTVGQVARRAGVAVSALHFYEARGLIRAYRTAGNQRRYSRDVLRRVAIIKVAQEVGISLADIAAAFDSLPEGRTPTREDWSRLSSTWRDDLDRDRKSTRLNSSHVKSSYAVFCLKT